jgi:hypothetical protein
MHTRERAPHTAGGAAMLAGEARAEAAGGAAAPQAAPHVLPPLRDALCAAGSAQQQAEQAQQPPVFSCYRYGFRFMASELALLERCFACTGGATPCRADLLRLAATLSAAPARTVAPPHPVSDKQVKARVCARRGARARSRSATRRTQQHAGRQR